MAFVDRRYRIIIITLIALAACSQDSGSFTEVSAVNTSLVPEVVLDLPPEMYVGSWAQIQVTIDPASGLAFDDLEFEIPNGRAGGVISYSREADFDPSAPTIMLAAGYQPGTHQVEVYYAGVLIAADSYDISADWTGDEGPAQWIWEGMPPRDGAHPWGELSAAGKFDGVQNLRVAPAIGRHRVAVVLLDTSSQRFVPDDPSTIPGVRSRWLREMFTGEDYGDEGIRSLARYFDEASEGQLTIIGDDADVYGPVSLPNAFEDYFEFWKLDNSGYYKYYLMSNAFQQSAITAAQNLIDYRQYDSVVFVVQEVPGTGTADPAKEVWPNATLGKHTFTSDDGDVELGLIAIRAGYGMDLVHGAHEIASHELGHNLFLGDMHSRNARDVKNWDLMSSDIELPQFSLSQKIFLGWVDDDELSPDVVVFDGESLAAGINEKVALAPAELVKSNVDPVGIQLRLANGVNYFAEYRVPQSGQISDQALPRPSSVLITLGTSRQEPYGPWIELAEDAGNGALGSTLQTGEQITLEKYEDPATGSSVTLEVVSQSSGMATIEIVGSVTGQADPSIRKWPSEASRWQSPDIYVRNERSLADSTYWNMPWIGRPNEVWANIWNSGDAEARDVAVSFWYKNFAVSKTEEHYIGKSVVHVPPRGVISAFADERWIPAEGKHYCVIARIDPYTQPITGVPETSDSNNEAQSNYTGFISSTASPWSREETTVTVHNPYLHSIAVVLNARQTNPLYKMYLGHRWLHLSPGGTAEIPLMFEYAGQEFLSDDGDASIFEAFQWEPNHVTVEAIASDHQGSDSGYSLGGAEAVITQGLRTAIEDFTLESQGAEGYLASGNVSVVKTGVPAPDSTVLFTLDHGQTMTVERATTVGGTFSLPLPLHGWRTVSAYYLPPDRYGDAESSELRNPKP